jgi:outer membrane protein OmpA-like peptidoglycan-associated protein
LFSDDPRAAAYNPAAAADRELPAFGSSAFLALPSGAGSGAGGGASVFSSFPTAAGTIHLLADGTYSPDSLGGYRAPAGFSVSAGISKAAFEGSSLGAAFGAVSASGDQAVAGFYGSLGVQTEFPSFGPKGTTLSAAVLGLGPSLSPWDGYAPVVSWTPILAASVRLSETRRFSLSAAGMVASRGFSDLLCSIGASFGFGELALDAGWLFSLAESGEYYSGGAGSYAPRLLPALSIRYDSSSRMRAGDYGAAFGVSARPLSSDASAVEASVLFSRGSKDIEGPAVSIGPIAGNAFSAKTVAELLIPVSAADPSGIGAWEIAMYGETGVSYFKTGDDAAASLPSGWLGRLFSLRRGVKAPTQLRVPIAGLPDGMYRLRLWSRDLRGNESRPAVLQFTMDSTAPRGEASLGQAAPIFTPNGDGSGDSLAVNQSGSVESLWTGFFIDAVGRRVREFRWTDSAPLPFVWDGKDDTGRAVPDGVYSYSLEAADVAGNKTSVLVPGIVVDTIPTPLRLGLDETALSPDRDGSFDTVRLSIVAPVKRGIVDWTIDLVSNQNTVFRAWKGSTARLDVLPGSILFDGRSIDGDTIPDGSYRFRATLRYANGNAPVAVSEPFVVDTKRPEGRVRASSSLWSIGRSGAQVFYHDLSRNAQWRGVVTSSDGTEIRGLTILRGGEGDVEWNGLDESGVPVPDGLYRYHAEGRSATGIPGKTASASFRIESGGAAVALLADRTVFSPNVARSVVRILPRLERRERAISYSLEIRPASGGVPVKQYSGVSVPPSSFIWDGRDEADRIPPDDEYAAVLSVKFENGGESVSDPVRFSLDGTPPAAMVSASSALFSPNGDGALDAISISQSAATDESWLGEILDAEGRTVFFREFDGALPASIVWDGKTAHGDLAPDGEYRYRLSAADKAGNAAAFTTDPFRLDARRPTATLSADKFAFSPNGDGFADALKLSLVPSFADGLDKVAVFIRDASGREVRSLGDGALRGEYIWDGTQTDGSPAGDGIFVAVVELRYFKGDVVRAESSEVRVDATPPRLGVVPSPLPFSPDGDGENDLLKFSLSAEDASPLAGWSLSILDPEGYPFASFAGRDVPSVPLEWDGADADGNLVEAAQDYSYEFLVRDQLGNVARSGGIIPVDVFVLRDGERLKIRISSITFAPNKASLQLDDAAQTERNRAVLDRIAAVLGKFPNYRIRVEGHAVNLSGTEREERTELQPLSLARAKAVVEALAARGIGLDRLEAVGLGGREPIVPHGDVQGRWRNRRVEFVLVR